LDISCSTTAEIVRYMNDKLHLATRAAPSSLRNAAREAHQLVFCEVANAY
jgi:hypothetical protein